jgi:hypothetical protein
MAFEEAIAALQVRNAGHETHDARSPQSHTQAKDSKQAAATGKATEKEGQTSRPAVAGATSSATGSPPPSSS